MYEKLKAEFFGRDTLKVAKDLVGAFIIHQPKNQKRLVARIVETEAYGENDPACHAYSNCLRREEGQSPIGRSALLFGPPGVAYVYLNYGVHWLFNVVTDLEGRAGAVLIRAVEPIEGLEQIQANRPKAKRSIDLTNGPGKLTAALNIGKAYHGKLLTNNQLHFAKDKKSKKISISRSGRIGISNGKDFLWRFFEADNQFVSQLPRHPGP